MLKTQLKFLIEMKGDILLKLKNHKIKLIVIIFSICFIVINYLAWQHTRSMTRFSGDGIRTQKPENLSMWQKIQVLFSGIDLPRPENERSPEDFGLSYDIHFFPNKRGEILEAWHIPASAEQQIVLLFHGYADSKESVIPIAVQLHNFGYNVFLVDFYGSGGSTGSETSIGYYEAEDVRASIRYVRESWGERPLVLYGVSMGGAAILRAIGTEDLSPGAIILEGVFDSLLTTIRNRFKLMHLPSFPAAELIVFWGSWQGNFNAFKFKPAAYAQRVTCPALVMHGESDVRVSLNEAKKVFDNLSGQKRFISYPGVSHQLIVTASRDDWKNDVANFLSELE